mgnify:FL=1
MPTYSYQCPECDRSRDIIKPLALLNREERCEACEAPMDRRLCAPAVAPDLSGYTCPITDKWIEGRRAHTENLKRHWCRVYEAGETDQVRRSRAKEEQAEERSVEETVERFYDALPTVKREQLAQEVASGVDLVVERK